METRVHTSEEPLTPARAPSLGQSLIPLGFLVAALIGAVLLYKGDAIGGPVQVAMFMSAAIAGLVGWRNGHTVAEMSKAAVDSVASAMGAIFILFAVGALIGTWNMSGTIATMTEYGIRFLNPDIFYVTVAVICAAIAFGVGSSWTVMGTIGVALIAIAEALGLNMGIAAGAVISGAYFGDKMSPLSETTNLAPAVSGTDLYAHIRALVATTVPSILITLGLYLAIGLSSKPVGGISVATGVEEIKESFNVGIIALLPLVLVIVLAVKKVHPAMAILAGALFGGLIAAVYQTDTVLAFVDDPDLATPWALLKGVWTAMANGFTADTGVPRVDELLSGGGMESMLTTIWLIMAALAFGGIMNHCGFLARLIQPLRNRAKTDRGIMVATGVTAIGINAIAADQYLAIVLTGNVYKQDFEERGIAPYSLSRQVEDTATVTSVLVPWNSCGAYATGVLGIETLVYLPFAFFNWINPLVSFIYDLLGFQIHRVTPGTEFPAAPVEAEFYGVEGQYAREVPADGTER